MKIKRTFLAILLTISMITGLLPVMAFAQTEQTVITQFQELKEEISNQTVNQNTPQEDLDLPEELEAEGYQKLEGEAGKPKPLQVPVESWIEKGDSYNDGAEEGTYTFTPVLDEAYELDEDVTLPAILVEVAKEENKESNDHGKNSLYSTPLTYKETVVDLEIIYTITELSDDSSACEITYVTVADKSGGNPRPCTITIPAEINGKTVKGISGSFSTSTGSDLAYQAIEGITIPDSVERITDESFVNLKNLTSLNLGKGVKNIGKSFQGLDSLTTVTIPASMGEQGEQGQYIFYNCQNLTDVIFENPETVLTEGSFALTGKSDGKYTFHDDLRFAINDTYGGEVSKYADKYKISWSTRLAPTPGPIARLNIVVTQSGEGEVTYPKFVALNEPVIVKITPTDERIYDVSVKSNGKWNSIFSEFEAKEENGIISYEKEFPLEEAMNPDKPLEINVIFKNWNYFSFPNSTDSFTNSAYTTYIVDEKYWNTMERNVLSVYLLTGKVKSTMNMLRTQAANPWGGSCFGFAAVEGNFNQGRLDISKFDSAEILSEAQKPVDNSEVKSLLNYYYLTQFLTEIVRDKAYFVGNEYSREDLKKLVENVKNGKRAMFSYFYGYREPYYGHAFMIDGYEGVGDNGSFQLTGQDNRFYGYTYAGVENGRYYDTGIPVTVTVEVDADYNGIRVLKQSFLGTDGEYVYEFRNIHEEVVACEIYHDFNEQGKGNRFSTLNILGIGGTLPVEKVDNSTIYLTAASCSVQNSSGQMLSSDYNGPGDSETTMEVLKNSFSVASTVDKGTNPVKGVVNEATIVDTPSTRMFEVKGQEDLTFTSKTEEPLSGDVAMLNDFAYSKVDTESAEKVQLNKHGSIEIKENDGSFKAVVTLNNGDGDMLNITGNVRGDISIVPTAAGVELKAPSGQYELTYVDGNDTTTETVRSTGKKIVLKKGHTSDDDTSSRNGGGGSSGVSPKNQPKITKNRGGIVNVTTNGEKITASPLAGYHVDTLTVNGSVIDTHDSNAIWEENGNVIYTFDKASSDNTVDVIFASEDSDKTQPEPKSEPETKEADSSVLPFTDVKESDWYYAAVKYSYENSLFQGLTSTQFGPNEAVTRGMLASVINRMENTQKATGSNPFTDVETGAYYENGILWAYENDIMSGYSEIEFGSKDAITREQLAAVLYRYAVYKGAEKKTTDVTAFKDTAAISPWAREAMEWAVANGILSGKGDGLLDPQGKATRGEVASMLQRFQQTFDKK